MVCFGEFAESLLYVITIETARSAQFNLQEFVKAPVTCFTFAAEINICLGKTAVTDNELKK